MDEGDLNRVPLLKNISLLLKQFYENCRSKTPSCRKLSHFSEIQNDDLIHSEGLTLTARGLTLVVRM